MMKPKSEVAVKIVFALLVNVVVNPLLALWALNLLGRHLSTRCRSTIRGRRGSRCGCSRPRRCATC